jgi:hypothetical protein
MGRLTVFLKKRTLPSPSKEFTPPGWKLRDAANVGALVLMQGGFVREG